MSSRSPSAAPQRAPTLQRIDVARQLLLTPFGLDESHLARALAEIRTHQVDDADLYFQYTRSEGWSLEEGIVKTGSFSIDQGVGVRAVSGEKTAFAYSDDISPLALGDAASAVRAIAAAGGFVGWLVNTLASALFGLMAGAVVVAILHLIPRKKAH